MAKTYEEMIQWIGETNARTMTALRANGADRNGKEYARAFCERSAHLEAICEAYGVDFDQALRDAAQASRAYKERLGL